MLGVEDSAERYLVEATEQDRFSGVVLLARGSDVLLSGAHNQACRRFGVPNQRDTRFDIASVGKMFTAVAIGQLVEAGLLSFDAPLATYLPDYPPAVAERVTIHHLLTHTSGLGSIFDGGWEIASQARSRTIDNLLPHFQDRPLLFEPGDRWEYSNAGYVLLGAVIESLTGRPYFDYIQQHVFSPARMWDSGAYSLDAEVPKLAYAYSRLGPTDRVDAEPRWNNVYRHWTTTTPAGCFYSTALDLLRFSLALRGGELLSTLMVAALTERTVQTGRRPGERYARGFFTEDLNGVRVFGHGGTIPGFQAWLDIYPSLDYTVIILTNFDAPAARNVVWLVREGLTGASPPPPLTSA